jgi:hypothetical protein
MHVIDEVDTSNFQNQPEVTQINRIRSKRLMEYREGGLLEPPFFDRFRGNIDTYILIYIHREGQTLKAVNLQRL